MKQFLDVSRMALWADAGDKKRARFILSFRESNPRFTVFTGVASGKDGIINFPSDIPTMTYVCTLLKEIADGPAGTRSIIDSRTSVYENDKATPNKRVVSQLYIGKSNEGIVYVSLIAENRPKIAFEFKPSEFHSFRDKENNEVPASIVSSKMAKGYADQILAIVSDYVLRYAVDDADGLNVRDGATNNSSQAAPVTSNSSAVPNIDLLDENIPY